MGFERPQKIIALTRESDDHLPYVERHLESGLIVIDPENIIHGDGLSYEFVDGELRIVYQDEILDNVKSIWYHKPTRATRDTFIKNDIAVEETNAEYKLDAVNRHYDMIRAQHGDALWVSNYYNIIRASQKPLQYVEAARLGFNVPDTIFTSNVEAARQFMSDHSSVVLKSISTVSLTNEEGEPLRMFTRIIDPGTLSLEGLEQTPSIFQEAITDIGVELRITVVGDKVFPAIVSGIDANDPTVRDWRVGYYMGNFKAEPFYELPPDVADSCVRLTKRLGLQYSAIDLIVDKQGKEWFLEINPNGQWLFIENQTGQPIGQAIADLLETGRRE